MSLIDWKRNFIINFLQDGLNAKEEFSKFVKIHQVIILYRIRESISSDLSFRDFLAKGE